MTFKSGILFTRFAFLIIFHSIYNICAEFRFMTAEFIIIYYSMQYWTVTDIEQTDSFFHSPGTDVEARRSGMNEYLHLFTTIYITVL